MSPAGRFTTLLLCEAEFHIKRDGGTWAGGVSAVPCPLQKLVTWLTTVTTLLFASKGLSFVLLAVMAHGTGKAGNTSGLYHFCMWPEGNRSTISPGEEPSPHSDSPTHSPSTHPERRSAFVAEGTPRCQMFTLPSRQEPGAHSGCQNT